MNEKVKITFMPGCFDSFEGTQEELDELIKEIRHLADSGLLLENSESIDEDEFQPSIRSLQ